MIAKTSDGREMVFGEIGMLAYHVTMAVLSELATMERPDGSPFPLPPRERVRDAVQRGLREKLKP